MDDSKVDLPGEREVTLKIGELINSRNMTQAQLSELTGIRRAAISQLSRGYVSRLSLDHLTKLADALEIDDINEIITIEQTK